MDFHGNPRVLITGVSGFTGKHLVHALSSSGFEVLGLGQPDPSFRIDHLNANLSETAVIADWIAEKHPTHIIHLAARSHVVGDASAFFDVNVLGTESLLQAITQSRVRIQKILIASSANIYGNGPCHEDGLTEDSPIQPMNHYALSKACMELLVKQWFDQLPIIITRPFNYTGIGQSSNFLIPKIVDAFCRRDNLITLGNINISRDFSDVAVVCEAYKRLIISDYKSIFVNICSGTSSSILQVLEIMSNLSNHTINIQINDDLIRKNDITELKGNPSLLHKLIGSLPHRSITEILIKIYNEKKGNCIE